MGIEIEENKNIIPRLFVSKCYLMLVAFCIYLSPRVLTSSMLSLLGFCPLKAISSLALVSGDGLELAPGAVGGMLSLDPGKSHK